MLAVDNRSRRFLIIPESPHESSQLNRLQSGISILQRNPQARNSMATLIPLFKVLQNQHAQRRDIDFQTMRAAVQRFAYDCNVPEISDVAATVDLGITV